MKEKILIFGHRNPDSDTILSSLVKERFETKKGNNVEAVALGTPNKETQYVLDYLNIKEPRIIEKVEEGQQVILIDHNEFAQSAPGIENAKIIEVIDHHKIANIETCEPLFYTARPYGCTSTILYEMYKYEYLPKGMFEIGKEEAILMAGAIISDTLLLKSPTTTKYDVQAIEELEKIAGIDLKEFGLAMLKAGTDLDDYTGEELVNLDAKNLDKDGIKYVIAQVNTASIPEVLKRQEELEEAMKNEINKKGLDLFVLAITDILNSNSQVISLGKRATAIEKAFDVKLENNSALLKGVVSRKKQLLPNICKNLD